MHGTVSICPPDCFHYKGTLDTLYKIVQQEGLGRLWRGTHAGLALAIPTVGIYLPCYDIFRNSFKQYVSQLAPGLTPYVPLAAGSLARSLACASCYPIELAKTRMQAFKQSQNIKKPPGVWKTLHEIIPNVRSSNNMPTNSQSYRVLWTGMGAQLARDVPLSAICWSTLEQIRRKLLGIIGEEASPFTVFGANFSAGFVAGTLQLLLHLQFNKELVALSYSFQKDPVRALTMTTRQTLLEGWRHERAIHRGRSTCRTCGAFRRYSSFFLRGREACFTQPVHMKSDWDAFPIRPTA
ncbi:hypothetical protein MLD38_025702 [Melastoma candidum]|uniref:Uncharacterized protein n=1 Tax=Melastoma candidum TaxID=119954 RepID=A0ACB9NXK7_9MYRT|nr:hypothetical protein MLD38_025702 [Melastoma candidum]